MINGELIVDNFAGGGGASTGIELATGYSVDIAINHDPEAIKMHKANHPNTKHYCENVWAVDPVKACKGHPVGLAWFSPDCKHFSKAKGGKPKDKNIRGLAWVACRWAGLVRPRVIMLENVEEFKTWGPLNRGHHPIKAKQGKTFKKFVQQLNDLGYEVQFKELIAADYGAPTMRKRFFMIARCDGKSIVWPEPTHAPADSEEVKAGLLKPYYGSYYDSFIGDGDEWCECGICEWGDIPSCKYPLFIRRFLAWKEKRKQEKYDKQAQKAYEKELSHYEKQHLPERSVGNRI